jgi:hypothetical protein
VEAFEGLKTIQHGGRCHGNQGAKNVKSQIGGFLHLAILNSKWPP